MLHRKTLAVTAAIGCLVGMPLSGAFGKGKPAGIAVPTVRTVKSLSEPPLTIGVSLSDDLTSGTPASVATWDTRAHTEGTQLVRLDVDWNSVAITAPASPTNPNSSGYDWTTVDQEVEDLAGAGFKIMITVQNAPKWAEGANMPAAASPGSWEPSSSAFGEFATAIATRYDGSFPNPAEPGTDLPLVSDWQAWNEPNLPLYLSPSWVHTSSGWTDQAAIQYRSMLDAFYSGVTAVSPTNFVIAAGTAPYGDPAGTLARVPPVTFDQDLFCLTPQNQPTGNCPNRAEFDAVDHHPYVSGQANEGPTWHAQLPDDVSIPDIYKLTAVLHAAEVAGTVLPAGAKGVWVTEIAWESDPPQPASAGVPVAEEGRWAEQALYVLWSEGVQTALWYELGDPAESAGGLSATYDDGLYFNNGNPKPASQGFRFPFLTNRRTANTVEAWGRSPRSGTLWVQKQIHGRWASILKFKVKSAQVFEVPIALRGSGNLRAVIGGVYSLTWPQSA